MLLRNLMACAGGLPSLPNSDDFSTNTIANYTVTQDSGSPAWSVSSGSMVATGAFSAQSVCRRNGFSQADVAVETLVSQAEDSGLVLRFQDQSNFYLLTMSDNSGGAASTKLRIFKRVSGTFTQLGSSYNFEWVRGINNTVRFAAAGSALTAYLNGTAVITATDSAITAAGAIGMRSNSSNNDRFDTLSWG